jgi:hypothetical protein
MSISISDGKIDLMDEVAQNQPNANKKSPILFYERNEEN